MAKHHDGIYQAGITTIKFPITPDEALYQFHLCEWVLVPDENRSYQQIHSRKIENGVVLYNLIYSLGWFSEDELIRTDTRISAASEEVR